MTLSFSLSPSIDYQYFQFFYKTSKDSTGVVLLLGQVENANIHLHVAVDIVSVGIINRTTKLISTDMSAYFTSGSIN